jgi:hypothetical protein
VLIAPWILTKSPGVDGSIEFVFVIRPVTIVPPIVLLASILVP